MPWYKETRPAYLTLYKWIDSLSHLLDSCVINKQSVMAFNIVQDNHSIQIGIKLADFETTKLIYCVNQINLTDGVDMTGEVSNYKQ